MTTSTRTPLILVYRTVHTQRRFRAGRNRGCDGPSGREPGLAGRDHQDRGHRRGHWPTSRTSRCPARAGTAELIKRLARKLLDLYLDREIKDIDKTITERFRDHPYARIIESLPRLWTALSNLEQSEGDFLPVSPPRFTRSVV